MALERGMLAKIDRRLSAEMDQSLGNQMVRVPVSDALWSAWRRYCDLFEVSMGEAIGGLIATELRSVIDRSGRTVSEMVDEFLQKEAERLEALDERQRHLDSQADALRRKERALVERERAQYISPRRSPQNTGHFGVDRNEPCPCGSSLKYKRCHGRPS